MIASAQTQLNLGTQSKNANFGSLTITKPVSIVTTLSGVACTVGQMAFVTTASPGQNLYGCTSTNSWSLLGGAGGGGTVTSVGISLPALFACNSTPITTSGTLACSYSITPGLVAGTNVSIAGTWPNQTINATGSSSGNATSIQGINVSSTAPTSGQALEYNGSAYQPTTLYSLINGLGTSVSGTSTLAVNISMGFRTSAATNDNLVNTDCGGVVSYSSASAVNVSIPQASLSGNFLAGCPVTVRANGAGSVTLTPSGSSSINGTTSLTVNAGKACAILSDGSSYQIAGECN
ncbi:unnamed protein product [Sphagnum balticum]